MRLHAAYTIHYPDSQSMLLGWMPPNTQILEDIMDEWRGAVFSEGKLNPTPPCVSLKEKRE